MNFLACSHIHGIYTHDSRRYREYAFLRTEEEREQFLCHLLTLTARDFTCFTTGFSNASKEREQNREGGGEESWGGEEGG